MSTELQGSIFHTILSWSINLLIAAAVLWLVLSLFDYFRRRALNLTSAETVNQTGVKPGFLTVDQAKRQAALNGGSAFDSAIASRNIPPQVVTKACGWARMAALALAALSLATGTIGALLRVRSFDTIVKDFGSLDSAAALISLYPWGFAIAMVVVLVGLANFIKTAREVD